MNLTRTRILTIVLRVIPMELSAGVRTTATWYNIEPYTMSPHGDSALYFCMKGVQPWYLGIRGKEVHTTNQYGCGVRDLPKSCLWSV